MVSQFLFCTDPAKAGRSISSACRSLSTGAAESLKKHRAVYFVVLLRAVYFVVLRRFIFANFKSPAGRAFFFGLTTDGFF